MPIDYTKRPSAIPTSKAAKPSGTAATPPGDAAPVSLSKVRLTKAAPTVSLAKHGGSRGMLQVNLNWDARPPAKGFFKKTIPLDLDLGCLYEFADGTKGVVQALGNAFTARNRQGKQLLRLDGDDRSGSVST